MQLAKVQGGNVTQFDPKQSLAHDITIDAVIEHAKKLKDWPVLEAAVAEKIEQQKQFVGWWERNVSGRQSPGRGGNKSISDRKLISAGDAESETGISSLQVHKWRKRLAHPDKYREQLFGVAYKAAMGEDHNHRAQGTGENEWYTPAKYIEMARDVLGEFDLDPATSEVAQQVVQARKFFTKADNGLEQQWEGRVWLNPPYAQPLISQFVEKLVEERCADRVSAAILLTHNYTDTAWFHGAMEIADAVCFTRGRIKFVDSDGGECAPTQGQAFFYFGEDAEGFAARFREIGFVVFPYVGEVKN